MHDRDFRGVPLGRATSQEFSLHQYRVGEMCACGVAFEFGDPEFAAVRRRRAVFAAAVAVPEAAVDEDGGFVFGEDDVGAAGEVFGVEAEAVADAVKDGADEEFGFGVFALDAGHIPGPPSLVRRSFICPAAMWGSQPRHNLVPHQSCSLRESWSMSGALL